MILIRVLDGSGTSGVVQDVWVVLRGVLWGLFSFFCLIWISFFLPLLLSPRPTFYSCLVSFYPHSYFPSSSGGEFCSNLVFVFALPPMLCFWFYPLLTHRTFLGGGFPPWDGRWGGSNWAVLAIWEPLLLVRHVKLAFTSYFHLFPCDLVIWDSGYPKKEGIKLRETILISRT